MTRIGTRLLGLMFGIYALNFTPVQASEWLCSPIGSNATTILNKVVTETSSSSKVPTGKLSNLSDAGGKFSNKNGSFEFENISYYEGNKYLGFLGQRTIRSGEGVIQYIANYDFNGNKLDKSGVLVVRSTRDMAFSYNLTAFNCDLLG